MKGGKNMPKLEIAGWKKMSCDDGPGIRSVLFLQGCSMKCEGCHNVSAKNKGEGVILDIDYLAEYIIGNCNNKKLTLSGGEPLEQWGSLKELVIALKKNNFNICLYTGWDEEKIPERVFELMDYIKCGAFVSSLSCEEVNYVGSSNQKLYKKDMNNCWNKVDIGI